MKAPLSRSRSSATFAASSAVPGRPAEAPGEHVLINIPAQADELAQRQRRDDDAGCNGVEPLGSNPQLSSPSESSFPVSSAYSAERGGKRRPPAP